MPPEMTDEDRDFYRWYGPWKPLDPTRREAPHAWVGHPLVDRRRLGSRRLHRRAARARGHRRLILPRRSSAACSNTSRPSYCVWSNHSGTLRPHAQARGRARRRSPAVGTPRRRQPLGHGPGHEPARRGHLDLRPWEQVRMPFDEATYVAETDGIRYLQPEIVTWMKAHRDRVHGRARPGRNPAAPRSVTDGLATQTHATHASRTPLAQTLARMTADGFQPPELLPAPSAHQSGDLHRHGAARTRAARWRLGVCAGHGAVCAGSDQQPAPAFDHCAPTTAGDRLSGHGDNEPTNEPTTADEPTAHSDSDASTAKRRHGASADSTCPKAFATRARPARSSTRAGPRQLHVRRGRGRLLRAVRERGSTLRGIRPQRSSRRDRARQRPSATTRTRTARSRPRAIAGHQSTSTRWAASRSAVSSVRSTTSPSITWTDDRLHILAVATSPSATRTDSSRSGRERPGPFRSERARHAP